MPGQNMLLFAGAGAAAGYMIQGTPMAAGLGAAAGFAVEMLMRPKAAARVAPTSTKETTRRIIDNTIQAEKEKTIVDGSFQPMAENPVVGFAGSVAEMTSMMNEC